LLTKQTGAGSIAHFSSIVLAGNPTASKQIADVPLERPNASLTLLDAWAS